MANHNFNFKETYTEEEKQNFINNVINRYNQQLCFNINENFIKEAKHIAEKMLKEDMDISKMANETDIPEEFNDLWLIYSHSDNDFSLYFNDINRKLALDYLENIKNSLYNFCYIKYYSKKEECETLTETIKTYLYDDCKFLTNIETYYNIVRYYVAIEAAKRDCNNKGFENEFNHILKYFSINNEEIKKSLYIGKTEEALEFLNNIKFDNSVNEVTEENFNKIWWNGDVSITHIKNGTITQI